MRPRRRRAAGPGWWRSQRGQSTALVLSMLMVFILLVAMVVNVGQAVNRKIALQLVADTGAFTGATVMAEGLNYMAYANSWIQDLWGAFTIAWTAARIAGSSCNALSGTVSTYQTARAPFAAAYEVINRVYTLWPYVEARRISEYNVDDLFPGERAGFSFREIDLPPAADTGFIACTPAGLCRDNFALMASSQVPDGTNPETSVPWVFDSERRWTSICTIPTIPFISSRNFNLDVWFKRDGTAVRYFVWRVRAPATKALMFDWFFGPNAIPSMTAVAVAKPVGGSIEKGRPRYVAKMVPVRNVMRSPGGIIVDPDIGPRVVTH